MTAKTILLACFLTCLGLCAQTSAAPAAPPTSTNHPRWDVLPSASAERFSELPAAGTNRAELPREMLHSRNAGLSNPPPARTLGAPAAAHTNPPSAIHPGAPLTLRPGASPAARPNLPAPAAVPAQPPPTQPAQQMVQIHPTPPATKAPKEEMLPAGTINFPATDLNQVLEIYAKLVGRTVLRPTSLPAPTITLKTETPLTRSEAIQAFDAVLALNGIAMINVGDKFVKVVPMAQAGQVGAKFNDEPVDQLPDMGQFVTHVVQLHNVKPSEVVQALQPFASSIPNPILPIDSSQILVLRDYAENVKRMLEMLQKIDVSVPSEYVSEVIPIKYAMASDIANALNSLSSGGGGTTVGSAASGHGTSRSGGFGSSRMNNFGGFGGVGNQMGGYGGYNYRGNTATPYGSVTPYGDVTPHGGVTPFAGVTPNRTPAPSSFTQRLQNIIKKASDSDEIQVLGQTKIIADERTNSLLIFASHKDMKMIKDIVSKLDIVLAQVLIEAVIIQVSLNDNMNLGMSLEESSPHGIGNYFRGIGAINNNNMLSKSSFNIINGATNAAGALPGGFSYLGVFGNDLNATLTALATHTHAKVLQRPTIQTSHAVPAAIFVGQSRPYPTASYYGGGAYGGYASIQQLQIGVTLEVTPLINPDGLVVMDIHQKIDSFEGTVPIQNVGDVPITSSKEASATVAVRDHDTIMLGGLIEDDKNVNNSGVPFLKDIPLLGFLFRSSSSSGSRNELIVLIRPTVLPTPEVAALTAKAEKDKMPGIRRTEAEIHAEEVKRMRQTEKVLKNEF